MSPSVHRSVGWLIGRSVGFSWYPKRLGSYTSVLLSEHLFLLHLIVSLGANNNNLIRRESTYEDWFVSTFVHLFLILSRQSFSKQLLDWWTNADLNSLEYTNLMQQNYYKDFSYCSRHVNMKLSAQKLITQGSYIKLFSVSCCSYRVH